MSTNDPMDIAKKFEVVGSEEDSSQIAKELTDRGYEVKGVTAFKKEDIWEYLKEAKPQVLVMHNADPSTPDKILSGLFIMDHEAVDNSQALQRVIQGALGDDIKNDAVHELFVRTTLSGLHANQPPDVMIPILEKILGMDPSKAATINADADKHMATINKKRLN